jgi:hypothetical protein
MNFVPAAAGSFAAHAAYAGNVYERSVRRTVQRYHADCWSVITPCSTKTPASSRVNTPILYLLLVHLCNTLPALAMLMIARCGVTAEETTC